jgi:hypothetical protein
MMALTEEQLQLVISETGQPGILVRAAERLAALCGTITPADLIAHLSARVDRDSHPSRMARWSDLLERGSD